MVKKHLVVLIALISLSISVSMIGIVQAQIDFSIDCEFVKIWINEDQSIDLFYNITITNSGQDIHYITVGQPKRDFTINETKDQYGRSLTASDASSDSNYLVQVNLAEPLTMGHTIWFALTTNIANMIYPDTQNLGNVGMQFIPTWWPQAVTKALNLSIVLPLGVNSSSIKTSVNWDNLLVENDGRLAVYWQRQNIAENQQFKFGVSYPGSYVPPPASIPWWLPVVIVLAIAVSIILGLSVIGGSKKLYQSPTVGMETLGIRRGLTAVEASYLLDMKPPLLVTEILYSLLQKRAVWVESTNPSIKLRTMPEYQNKTGPKEKPLRYYEIDFLNAVKPDGTLDEEKLAHTVMFLRDTVEEEMHGYRRNDTIEYYRKIVNKAWQQVTQAGTPELTSKAYDEQLLWLLMDPDYQNRTKTIFSNKTLMPDPLWWWFWFGYQQYRSHPAVGPALATPPTQTTTPPTIPGSDFANSIVASVEKTSNNIVLNLEKFANSILPSPSSKVSHDPAHHGASCVCACHACACACACVSCACACAGGGVG